MFSVSGWVTHVPAPGLWSKLKVMAWPCMDLTMLAVATGDASAQHFEKAEGDLANTISIKARIISTLESLPFFLSTVNAATFIKREIPLGQLLTFKEILKSPTSGNQKGIRSLIE